jgi:serine protease
MVGVACPVAAGAADYVPDEVLVRYKDGTTRAERAATQAGSATGYRARLPSGARQLAIRDGGSVGQTVRALRRDPNVAYAVPNYKARASALIPNDPEFRRQWNLVPPFGINMPEAWTLARQLGAPGGRGAVVAVLDTGVAFRNFGRRYRRAPDLRNFARGYDFVDDDRYPFDLNGHGTFVASLIGETTNNGILGAGVAYRAKIMPLRVLDSRGEGDTASISRAIRYAVKRGAHVINLSLEFRTSVSAREVPDVISAMRYAHRKRVVVVAASGNEADVQIALPARYRGAIAVGATTVRGCAADYANTGRGLDIVAPGGGEDAGPESIGSQQPTCRPDQPGPDVFAQTFTGSLRRFGMPSGYEGTSMAAPHVSAVAALLMATRRLGRRPTADGVQRRMEQTARDLGAPGYDGAYGFGLLDAAAALR